MLAAYYTGDRTVSVSDCDPSPPRPGEVVVDVAYTGICGTGPHIFHGAMDARVSMPAVLRHEMSGTVSALCDDVAASGRSATGSP